MSPSPTSTATRASRRDATSLPRLLAGVGPDDRAVGLDEHLRLWGSPPWWGGRHRGKGDPSGLVAAVERSGLAGRGGARFPTGRKLRAVAENGPRTVVVANGTEGEPASAKDKLLMAACPHLVLDGALLAAEAVGAGEVVVCVDAQARAVLAILDQALAERASAGLDRLPVSVAVSPSGYVAGEESALIHWLNRGPAIPTAVPPRPFQRGVRGRPTLVQNVETLAHLALIARFGDEWFRALGTVAEPGSTLLTVSGAVRYPGVVEATVGTSIGDVVATAGGPTAEVGAFLVGGYFGAWLPAAPAWTAPLSQAGLTRLGGFLGTGVVVALPADACGLVETARVVRYLAGESAGQCGPCVHGLASIAGATAELAGAGRHRRAEEDLARWTAQVRGRGACHHPDGVANLVDSALRVFSGEIEVHARTGRCPATGRPPVLPVPR
ncbi:MAG: proton-conducting membrane transporter [Acidimicrobiales bacterium]|nr:MAG: proton-conducting membrane transporter [Acidimicrobiales bacterium]